MCQGDCFSPPAFLLVVEILGLKIRQNNNITGINLGHTHKKQAQFADDLWAALKADQENLNEFFQTVDCFSGFTGLRPNYDKTQIMRIGSLKDSQAVLFTQKTVSWSRRVKILGLWFTADKKEMCKLNYDTLSGKIDAILNAWHSRGLTPLGKITVINTLVVSQMVYYFMNMYNPVEQFFMEVDKKLKHSCGVKERTV